MISASLTRRQLEAAPDVGIARTCAAEMDHCGQLLLMFERREIQVMALQSACDGAIEIRRRELHRMGRDHPCVQAIEPARIPIAPRAIFGNGMIVDAIASGLGKGAIGDLVHADCARRGAEYVERLGIKGPSPVSAHHRIAGTFDLRERRAARGKLRSWNISEKGERTAARSRSASC